MAFYLPGLVSALLYELRTQTIEDILARIVSHYKTPCPGKVNPVRFEEGLTVPVHTRSLVSVPDSLRYLCLAETFL